MRLAKSIAPQVNEDVKKWEVCHIKAKRLESNLTVAGIVEAVDMAV